MRDGSQGSRDRRDRRDTRLSDRSVLPPVESRIAKRFDRHTSQEVCPWNVKFSRDATEVAFTPRAELETPDLVAFATMDEAEFAARFRDTPLARAKRAGVQRNTVAAVRNWETRSTT
jgi:hypothetical protein